MSNFITNLARRGAGLPLAAACGPSPARIFESSFGASEGLSEITSEEIVRSGDQTPAVISVRTTNTSSAREIQRAPLEHAGTAANAAPPSAPTNPTIVLQPSTPSADIVSPKPIIRNSETGVPHATEIMARPTEVVSRDFEFKTREASAPSQVETSAVASPVASDPPATIPRLRQKQESALLQTSVKEVHATTLNRIEVVAAEHLIRPAPAEPAVSLEFPRIASAPPSTPPPALPIEVRIGRVEVRGTPAVQQSTPATRKESPALGFASYHRLRRYRN